MAEALKSYLPFSITKTSVILRATDETPLLGETSETRTEGRAVSGEERPYDYNNKLTVTTLTTIAVKSASSAENSVWRIFFIPAAE